MAAMHRLLLALPLLMLPLPEQTPPKISGAWTVHFSRTYKNLHTGETTTTDETGQMVLRVRGDSLFGFWQWPSTPGEPEPAARTVRGVLLRDGAARVQVDADNNENAGFFSTLGKEIVEWIKEHVHNSPTTIPVYEFTVRGDSLVGTRRTIVASDGEAAAGPRPFYATRVKN
jgi:hypothetical protein